MADHYRGGGHEADSSGNILVAVAAIAASAALVYMIRTKIYAVINAVRMVGDVPPTVEIRSAGIAG